MKSLNERDKRIISDLYRFRCLSRKQIELIHFSHTKRPKTNANFVLKRLRNGYVKADTTTSPYIYYPSDSRLKMGSQKVEHFLEIATVYIEMRSLGRLRYFEVEPKLDKKGTVEPDIFTIWCHRVWFIEIQRSIYSDKTMKAKLKRYEQYFREGKWRNLDWQPKKPVFPFVWIIGERSYNTNWLNGIKVFQSNNVRELYEKINRKVV